MGTIVKTLAALLIGIFSASLAVIFQNDIAAMFGRAPIVAEISVGPWYPHFDSTNPNLYSQSDEKLINQFSDPEEVKFLRLRIINKSGVAISHVYLTSEEKWADFNAVIVKDGEGSVIRKGHVGIKKKIDFGEIDAASEIIVYIWRDFTLGYPFDLDGIKIVTSNGQIPTSVNRISGDGTSYVFGIHTETMAWIFVIVCFAIGLVLIIILSHQSEFIKFLFKSDDYYLEQREIFEADPEKYQMPGTLPTATK